MGNLTQFEEDATRLPAGIRRVGYDADTQRYTFQDECGVIYNSEPGNAYGILRPVDIGDTKGICRDRPNAFAAPSDSSGSGRAWMPGSRLNSFDEFLPSTAITSTSPPEQSGLTSPVSRLTSVSLKVKSMKSAVSQLQASQSEAKPHQQRKSHSLLFNLGKSRSSWLRPSKSKSQGGYGELRGGPMTDDGDKSGGRLLQSRSSYESDRKASPASTSWSSSRQESFYENASASSHSSQTLSEDLEYPEKLLHQLQL